MADFMTEELKEWPVEIKKLTDLNPADYNPRVISTAAKAGLAKSIERFGLVQPIVWNKRSGNIVGGHQRCKVLKDNNIEETEVVIVDLNETEEIALNIALNNPEIQGDFTDKTIDQLDQVSQAFNDEFAQLGFADLREELNERFREKGETVPVHKIEQKATKKKNKEVIPDDRIIIECPKCQGQFRKSDKKILHNS